MAEFWPAFPHYMCNSNSTQQLLQLQISTYNVDPCLTLSFWSMQSSTFAHLTPYIQTRTSKSDLGLLWHIRGDLGLASRHGRLGLPPPLPSTDPAPRSCSNTQPHAFILILELCWWSPTSALLPSLLSRSFHTHSTPLSDPSKAPCPLASWTAWPGCPWLPPD